MMEHLEAAGVTLNANKCEFGKRTEVSWAHSWSDGNSTRPKEDICYWRDEDTSQHNWSSPIYGHDEPVGEVFSKHRSHWELLSTKKAWLWGPSQEQSFQQVKEELSHPAVLVLYNPHAKSKISADASAYGLETVLQQQGEQWRPVAYASRSMNEAEQRYIQIEEALAITWACQKFSKYILGSEFLTESDHKPLIPPLESKWLDHVPPRIVFLAQTLKIRLHYWTCTREANVYSWHPLQSPCHITWRNLLETARGRWDVSFGSHRSITC